MAINLFSGGNYINSIQAAGKNAVINGGMDIWQRGTTFAISNTLAYTADRWQGRVTTTCTTSFSRQTTSDTTNLPTIQYCTRVQRANGQTATPLLILESSMESVNAIPFAGQTVTFSFYARRGANFSGASNQLNVYLYSGTGTDQNISGSYTGVSNVVAQTPTLTTTWQRFTYTGTVPATCTELAAQFFYTAVGTAGAADYYEVTGVQLELGTTATTFSRAGGTIQGELAACQRYYYAHAVGANKMIGSGTYYTATTMYATVTFPVSMRVGPTIDQVTGTDFYRFYGGNGADGLNTLTIDASSPQGVTLYNVTQASGTLGYGGWLTNANNATSYLAFNAEL